MIRYCFAVYSLLIGLVILLGPPAAAGVLPSAVSLTDSDSTAARKSQWNVLPAAYYTPETSLALGAAAILTFRDKRSQPTVRPSAVGATFIYTLNGQILTGMNPNVWLADNRHHVYGQFGYLFYPFEFYGIGNDAPVTAKEPYTTELLDGFMAYEYLVAKDLYLGLRYDARVEAIIEKTGQLASQEMPIRGSQGQRISGVGPTLNYDSRDNVFFPTRGSFHQISAVFFGKSIGSKYDFQRYRFDFRKYFPIRKSVLAVQALGIITTGTPSFQYMALLGGAQVMRGYFAGRYRDNHLTVLQTEYRFPIKGKFKAVVFGSTGRVADRLSNLRLQNLHAAAGVGLRFRVNKDNLNIRFDAAIGQQFYPYFSFAEAF